MIEESKSGQEQASTSGAPPATQVPGTQYSVPGTRPTSGDSPLAPTTPPAPQPLVPSPPSSDSDAPLQAEPLLADLISIDEFSKVDLRVARVLMAEEVPGAKKLLKLTLGLGGDVKRQVFAGIKAAYKPEALVGRLVVVVANLQPRQMKFGLSEGMVTAVGPGETNVFLLALDDGAQPGMRVH